VDFALLALAALWLIVLLQSAALVEVLRQLAQVRAQLRRQGAAAVPNEGLDVGTLVPDMSTVRSLSGRDLPSNRDNFLLIFLSPDCDSCHELARGVTNLDLELGVPVFTFVRGDKSTVEAFARSYRLPTKTTFADIDGTVSARFNINTTPSATVVHEGRSLGHGVVNGPDQVAAFYDLAVNRAKQEAS
jgi:hypothetical protein